MTAAEIAALETFRAASDALLEAYQHGSQADLDASAWEDFSGARERISAAGHVLFKLSLRKRAGQPATLDQEVDVRNRPGC